MCIPLVSGIGIWPLVASLVTGGLFFFLFLKNLPYLDRVVRSTCEGRDCLPHIVASFWIDSIVRGRPLGAGNGFLLSLTGERNGVSFSRKPAAVPRRECLPAGAFLLFSFLDIVLRGFLMKVVLRIHGVRENLLFFTIFLRRVTYSTLSQTYPWTYLLS